MYAKDFRMSTYLDKSSGNSKVRLDFTLLLDRNRLNRVTGTNQELSVSILVGTNKDVLISHKTETISIQGFKSKSITLSFDNRVEEKGLDKVIVRVVCEDIRSSAIDYSLPLE